MEHLGARWVLVGPGYEMEVGNASFMIMLWIILKPEGGCEGNPRSQGDFHAPILECPNFEKALNRACVVYSVYIGRKTGLSH